MPLRRTGFVLAILLLTSAGAPCPKPWQNLQAFPFAPRARTDYVVFVGDPGVISKVMGVVVEVNEKAKWQYHVSGIHMSSRLQDGIRWESGDCADHTIRFPSSDPWPFVEPSGGPDSRSFVVSKGTPSRTFHLNHDSFPHASDNWYYIIWYTIDGEGATSKQRDRGWTIEQVGPDVVADG